jgi:hypothetical protein
MQLQATFCSNCATSVRAYMRTRFWIAALRRSAMLNLLGGICHAVPDTRTTAVIDDGTGPSVASMPEAPSLLMTAVATASPFGMSLLCTIIPRHGKWMSAI